jgi:general secretion pathway protein A
MTLCLLDTPQDAGQTARWSYESYWGLTTRPFDNVPDPRFYVPSVQHEAAKERMLYGIVNGKGLLMLTGEIGSGKTLMTRALTRQLPTARYEVGLIANPCISRTEFLGEVLFQLGLPPGGSQVDQLRRLNEQLLANYQRGVETVLVVDEAQAIQDEAIFEDLRLLSNFQMNDRFLLTLVVLGQPELRGRIARIPQLAQRIAVHSHLQPMTKNETKTYIHWRLAIGGCTSAPFSSGALGLIYEHSRGVCRLVNALCDASLYAGCRAKARRISRSLVRRVAPGILLPACSEGRDLGTS